MKVELSIKDDRELRNLIKDMIRGQVKSILREDLKEILREEAGDRIDRYFRYSSLESEVVKVVTKTAKTLEKETIKEQAPVLAEKIKQPLIDEVKKILSQDIGIILGQEIRKKAADVELSISVLEHPRLREVPDETA